MPMSVYQARQRHQWNYGLFAVGELAVVRSLVEESLDEWLDELGWCHRSVAACPGNRHAFERPWVRLARLALSHGHRPDSSS